MMTGHQTPELPRGPAFPEFGDRQDVLQVHVRIHDQILTPSATQARDVPRVIECEPCSWDEKEGGPLGRGRDDHGPVRGIAPTAKAPPAAEMITMRPLRNLTAGLGIEASGRDDVRPLGIALFLNLLRVGPDDPGTRHPYPVAPGRGTTPMPKGDADVEHGVVIQAEATVLARDEGAEELRARQCLQRLLRNLAMLLRLRGTVCELGDQLRGSVNQLLPRHRTSSCWRPAKRDSRQHPNGITSPIDREVSAS